jgi:hypothetical protein
VDDEKREKWLATLDPGIAPYVDILDAAGVETFESCQGGDGHCFPEPTVRFYGERSEGFRALAVAVQRELPVRTLRRYWRVDSAGEPSGPNWEMTFRPVAASRSPRRADGHLARTLCSPA